MKRGNGETENGRKEKSESEKGRRGVSENESLKKRMKR